MSTNTVIKDRFSLFCSCAILLLQRQVRIMKTAEYDKVCYWTEQRDEPVQLRNLKTGMVGVSFGCTLAGETVQVRLADGGLDSWERSECAETTH